MINFNSGNSFFETLKKIFMSYNLVEAAKGLFTTEITNKASSYLGESSSAVSKAISGILPTVFLGLADKSSTPEGANAVSQMAEEQSKGGILDNIGSFFGGDNSGLISKASGMLGSLFGNKSDALTSVLSGFSGLKGSSISSLLAMAGPLILSFLGKHASSNNLNANGLASLLGSQKQHIADAMPEGLNLQNVFSNSTAAVKSVNTATANVPRNVETAPGGGMKGIWWVVILALLGAAAWYFFKDGCNKKEETVVVTDTSKIETVPAETAPVVIKSETGTVDSMGNFVYNMGNMVTIDLPNAAGKLEVGENSTEAKLVRFLQSNEPIDSEKGNWFDFTNVRFKTGSADITEESLAQLKNMVLISKAFPKAEFKIGGYTDNTGDAGKNMSLSKSRAAAVAAKVKALGASAKSFISSDGYGDKYPIGDNATPEGRAQNRRVSVNVKAK